jgi:hypothetical protein
MMMLFSTAPGNVVNKLAMIHGSKIFRIDLIKRQRRQEAALVWTSILRCKIATTHLYLHNAIVVLAKTRSVANSLQGSDEWHVKNRSCAGNSVLVSF